MLNEVLKISGSRSIRGSNIRELAAGRWLEILAFVSPRLEPAIANIGRHVPCPIHGGKDGFRLFPNANETGSAVCNTCGPFSNGIKLIHEVNGWDYKTIVKAIADFLSSPSERLTTRASRPSVVSRKDGDDSRAYRVRQLNRVWQSTLPIGDPKAQPVRDYLTRRGIHLECFPASLRYHAALPYKDGREAVGQFPAMVAVIKTPDLKPVSLHRTYLTSDGNKAPVTSPKKLMPAIMPGATNGAAIRLHEPTSVLAVAEGIETALAVHTATEMPVWATVSAGGMKTLLVPDQVSTVWILSDHDKSGVGQEAARCLARRLISEGKQVYVVIPPKEGSDWNDVLLEQEGAHG